MWSIRKLITYACILGVVSLGIFALSSKGAKQNPSNLSNWMEAGEKPRVLATTAIVGDVVRLVGGERIDLLVLMPSEIDPHSYELVKGDWEKFDRASIVFSNGLNLEHSQSMHSRLLFHPNSVFLGDEVRKKEPSKIIYVNGQVDPHIWMDLSLWSESIDCIVEGLSRIDPSHAGEYVLNGKKTRDAFLAKDQWIFNRMQAVPEELRYLVTSHDAFNYFGRRYLAEADEMKDHLWLKRIRAIQGLAPDEQIGSLEIIEVVGFVCSQKIRTIYPEMNLTQDALYKVVEACRKRGGNVSLSKEPLLGDTLGEKSYLEMFDYNVDVLVRGFTSDE